MHQGRGTPGLSCFLRKPAIQRIRQIKRVSPPPTPGCTQGRGRGLLRPLDFPTLDLGGSGGCYQIPSSALTSSEASVRGSQGGDQTRSTSPPRRRAGGDGLPDLLDDVRTLRAERRGQGHGDVDPPAVLRDRRRRGSAPDRRWTGPSRGPHTGRSASRTCVLGQGLIGSPPRARSWLSWAAAGPARCVERLLQRDPGQHRALDAHRERAHALESASRSPRSTSVAGGCAVHAGAGTPRRSCWPRPVERPGTSSASIEPEAVQIAQPRPATWTPAIGSSSRATRDLHLVAAHRVEAVGAASTRASGRAPARVPVVVQHHLAVQLVERGSRRLHQPPAAPASSHCFPPTACRRPEPVTRRPKYLRAVAQAVDEGVDVVAVVVDPERGAGRGRHAQPAHAAAGRSGGRRAPRCPGCPAPGPGRGGGSRGRRTTPAPPRRAGVERAVELQPAERAAGAPGRRPRAPPRGARTASMPSSSSRSRAAGNAAASAMLGVPASKRWGTSFQVARSRCTSRIISPPPLTGSIASSSSGVADQEADPGRAVHLVGGEGQEVGAERGEVHGQVRHRLGRVHHHHGARRGGPRRRSPPPG